MIQCTHCGRVFEGSQPECPSCFKPIRDAADELGARSGAFSGDADSMQHRATGLEAEGFTGPAAPIARFTNAAEAGYFAHELWQHEGIPCSVTIEENFDAIGGYWSARFVLCVPEEEADGAAHSLKRLVEQTEPEELDEVALGYGGPSEETPPVAAWAAADGLNGFTEEGTRRTLTASSNEDIFGNPNPAREFEVEASGVNWVPIVLTLAAGSVVFWGVKRLQEQPKVEAPHRPAGAQHQDLWDHLATPTRPWVQQMDNGQGRRKLWIDPDGNVAVLREDADGDGLYENEIRIPRAALNQ